MTHPHHPVMIVTAAERDRANEAVAALTGREEDLVTFDCAPLSATGLEPATHYLAALALPTEDFENLQAVFTADFPTAHFRDSAHEDVLATAEALFLELNLRRVEVP